VLEDGGPQILGGPPVERRPAAPHVLRLVGVAVADDGEPVLGREGDDPAWDPTDPAPREGESYSAQRELEERVAELIRELPEAQRTALVLSRVKELRYQQIGEILSCSEQAVKSLIFRATQRLKAGLKGYLEDDR